MRLRRLPAGAYLLRTRVIEGVSMRREPNRRRDIFVERRGQEPPGKASLAMAALFLSLLPIPIVALQLLPTYAMHARFLIFYAPLICFLVLGYLLYIRDLLARVMFAGLFEEMESDPYYANPMSGSGRAIAKRFLAGIFNLLPALLLGASIFCVSRYVTRFDESVAIAGPELASRLPIVPTHDSATAGQDSAGKAHRAPDSAASPTSEIDALRRLPGLANDPNPLRTLAVQTAMLEDIPYFAELTALYIGSFACALAAVLLVILKEHSRNALRLSEEEILEGRLSEREATGDLGDAGTRRRRASD